MDWTKGFVMGFLVGAMTAGLAGLLFAPVQRALSRKKFYGMIPDDEDDLNNIPWEMTGEGVADFSRPVGLAV